MICFCLKIQQFITILVHNTFSSLHIPHSKNKLFRNDWGIEHLTSIFFSLQSPTWFPLEKSVLFVIKLTYFIEFKVVYFLPFYPKSITRPQTSQFGTTCYILNFCDILFFILFEPLLLFANRNWNFKLLHPAVWFTGIWFIKFRTLW